MLAFKYKPDKVSWPAFGQFKYNGIRAVWLNDHMQSRSYDTEEPKVWSPGRLEHIIHDLKKLMGELNTTKLRLDGELYCHGLSLQQINSRARVTSPTAHNKEDELKYYIFDIISTVPFISRVKWLDDIRSICLSKQLDNLVVVPTFHLQIITDFDRLHRCAMQEGYEGSMYRDPSASYGLEQNCGNKENRWKCLLKRKDWLDMECTIIGVNEGRRGKTGQFLDKAGSLILRTSTGVEFQSGGGLEISQRDTIWTLRDELIGKKAVILYDELSDSGKPLRNRIESIDDPRIQ